jgi:peptide/nickel transport system ATP-binding protein
VTTDDVPSLLTVDDLSIRFGHGAGALQVVRNVSFAVRQAETVALVGESGAGKSVTAKAVLRLLGPAAQVTSGTVLFGGRDLLTLPERELRRLRGGQVSMVVQDALSSLNPAHTVGSQVAEALRIHRRLPRRAAAAEAVDLLARTGIREPRQVAGRYPHQLSGGMRQRVVIASAIACGPRLIIADEPTTALDVTLQAQVLALLAQLASEEGTALLIITHDMGVVSDIADRVVVMYAGEVVESGAAADVLRRSAHPYTAALLGAVPGRVPPGRRLVAIPGQIPHPDAVPPGCAFHPRCEFARDSCAREHPSLALVTDPPGSGAHQTACPVVTVKQVTARQLAGPEPAEARPGAVGPAAAGRVLLRVTGLSKVFTQRNLFGLAGDATVTAVDDVSFEVPAGTTLGLVGESGSGKSTTARLIARLIEPSAGTVELDGTNLTRLSGEELRQRRRDVQVIFQDALGSLDPRRRVSSAIREPLRAFGDTASRGRVNELLDLVGLSSRYSDRAPHELSGGQRQRVVIARALALRPRLLICDEPVASLDVSIQAQVVNLLLDLQSELGLTCLFISHDLALVRHLSDVVAVMLQGKIVEHGPVEQVYEHPTHPYTQALVAAIPGQARTDVSA